jgi:O-antigen ligase
MIPDRGDDPSILAPVQPPHAVTMTAGFPQSEITPASRISLALLGLMVSLPFLNFHHSLPLFTFHTEWLAFALGTAALLALALARGTGIPLVSLGLIGLMLVLLVQVAAGMVAYTERSLLGALYLLWAALLVWLVAHLRERCGPERLGLALQVFIAFGGFLVAITGFLLDYQIDWLGVRLVSAGGSDGMFGSLAQRNHFANYLGCALASVVFLFARRWLSLPLATLLAAPLVLGLVLSTSRSAWIYVLLVSISACWTFWTGDRERLKRLLVFSLGVLILFASLNVVVVQFPWLAGAGAQTPTLGERWMRTVASGETQLGVQVRIYLLKEAWVMFAAHPFLGVGFGEFGWNLLEHGAGFDGINSAMTSHAHNALLDLLAETGLLGAFCVIVPLALWLKAFPWSRPDPDTGWMLTLIAIQAAHSMVEYPLWHANFLGLTAVLLGAAPQPFVDLGFSRFRQAAIVLVLAAGVATLVMVFSDYRNFERWYRQADASQRRNEPLSEAQLKDFAVQRAISLFAGYYDLLASELLVLNREDLDAKLELNTYALRFAPIPDAVFRQAVLLSLKGEHDRAGRVLSRLATMYPNALRDRLQRLEQMARDDPAAFAAFAAEAKREYGQAAR